MHQSWCSGSGVSKVRKACRAFLAVLMRTQDLRGSFLSTRAENCSSDTWSKREGGAVRWALNMGDLLNAKLTCDKRAGSGYFRYIVVSHPVQAARPTNLATKSSVKDERKLRPSRPFPCSNEPGLLHGNPSTTGRDRRMRMAADCQLGTGDARCVGLYETRVL